MREEPICRKRLGFQLAAKSVELNLQVERARRGRERCAIFTYRV